MLQTWERLRAAANLCSLLAMLLLVVQQWLLQVVLRPRRQVMLQECHLQCRVAAVNLAGQQELQAVVQQQQQQHSIAWRRVWQQQWQVVVQLGRVQSRQAAAARA